MTKGLFVKDPWISHLLEGKKTWEIRGFNTKYRGPLFLIKSGTGQAFGLINLVGTQSISQESFLDHKDKHLVPHSNISYKQIWAWKMSNPKIFPEPIDIAMKKGAVIFINLEGSHFDTIRDLYILKNL